MAKNKKSEAGAVEAAPASSPASVDELATPVLGVDSPAAEVTLPLSEEQVQAIAQPVNTTEIVGTLEERPDGPDLGVAIAGMSAFAVGADLPPAAAQVGVDLAHAGAERTVTQPPSVEPECPKCGPGTGSRVPCSVECFVREGYPAEEFEAYLELHGDGTAAPRAPEGLVECTVTTGTYQAEREYKTGETVLVPAAELAKLGHCLEPVK